MSQIELLRYSSEQLAYYMEQRQTLEEHIRTALRWLAEGLAEQGWQNVKDPDSLVQHVIDEFYLLMVDDTLVAFSVAEPWFMSCRVLEEELMAPVGRFPAQMPTIVKALEACAKVSDCGLISVGTRANRHHKALARFFTDAGCKLATMGLVKEIPHG